ncbi:MAG: hypothetical protein CSA38_04190 [Flavobacteriales bacterium]|nr:MAG: hypothetical protein CSA38_04190 [Flavobacteriales bacterium]
MKKSNIIISALFLTCFSWATAQEKQVRDDATIVMTKTELNDFVAKIKKLRRQKLLASQNRKRVCLTEKVAPKQRVEPKETLKRSSTRELLEELNTKVNYQYLKLLEMQIEDLKRRGGRLEVEVPQVQNQPKSYSSEFQALNRRLTGLESRLSQRQPTSSTSKTIMIEKNAKYDALVEQYSTYQKMFFFANNSAKVAGSDYSSIKEVANVVNTQRPHIKVQLRGYASKVGSPIYNVKLSKRRTDAVKNQLIRYGVPASYIEVLPLGEDQTAHSDAQARRVDLNFMIVK